MGDEIVLATIGSLGDVHPMIAVGQALQARGVRTRLAVPQDNVKKVDAAGLVATGILPSAEQICRDLGMTPQEVASRVIRDQDFMMNDLVLGYLEHCVQRLDAVSGNALAIVSPTLSPVGAIVAEMRNIPHIPVALQPMVVLSVHEPPYYPNFPVLLQAPRFGASRTWNRFCLAFLELLLRYRYLRPINEVRVRLGLPSTRVPPVFGLSGKEPLVLGLYSSLIGRVRPDFPANTVLTGFPVFDSDEPNLGNEDEILSRLKQFLAAGSPPIVFTLGSFAVHAPSDFYETSVRVARQLQMRCVLLSGDNEIPPQGDDVFIARYIPHSKVFPQASIIVHHGGIGTTGQALLAGKPQIVVPHFADQFDNACRLERLGVARTVIGQKYDVRRVIEAIKGVQCPKVNAKVLEAQQVVRQETGADTAARAIIKALGI